jgi:hypothetical protein
MRKFKREGSSGQGARRNARGRRGPRQGKTGQAKTQNVELPAAGNKSIIAL